MMILAGIGHPGADAVLGAAHLDDARQFIMEGDAPVPAIAAHIHEPAAAIDPGLHRIPHRRRVIFGMTAGHDDAIVAQKPIAVLVQILIGDEIVIDASVIEPIEEMGVGIVLIKSRTMAAEPGMILRREVEIGTQPRGIAHARAVGMGIVERGAELGMIIHVEIGMAELQEPAHLPLGAPRRDVLGMICVSEIGCGRGKHQDLGAVLTPPAVARWTYEEGDIILARRLAVILAALYMERIGPALEIGRNGNVDRSLPAGVIDVIVVEMDGAIVLRLPRPAMLLASPVPAFHAARRKMRKTAMVARWTDVDCSGRADLLREIPTSDDVREELRLDDAAQEIIMAVGAVDAGKDQGSVDLAVEMTADDT